jgi:hypothetical protein
VTLSVRVARYAASDALWNGSSIRVETGVLVGGVVATELVVDDVDEADVVEVVATTDVEDFGCCAL